MYLVSLKLIFLCKFWYC